MDSQSLILFSVMLLVDFTNIIVNIYLVHALQKLKKLRTLSFRLILLMSISDICVGCSALVSHISYVLCDARRMCPANFQRYADLTAFFFLYFAGRFTVIIAIDRFIRMRYLIRYDRIMTNLRAILLIAASALLGVVTSAMHYGPVSEGTRHYFSLGLNVFHTIGLLLGLVLYLWAYRSLRRKVDNLHIESNMGKETSPVENNTEIEKNRAVHNDAAGNCACGSQTNVFALPCKVRVRSASELKYKLGSECLDTSSNGPVNRLWVNSLKEGQGNNVDANTSNFGLEMDSCAKLSKKFATKCYVATKSHSIPNSYPCSKASDIAGEDGDMLVDFARTGPIVDPCGTAPNCASKRLCTSISPGSIDKEDSDRALPCGMLNAFCRHNASKGTTCEISKSLEMRSETKSSPEEEIHDTFPQTHNFIHSRQGLGLANEQRYTKVGNDLPKQGRDARVGETTQNIRRRPDQEFAKAVLLINVAIVFCYFPGLILYYLGLLPGIQNEKYVYAQRWGLLLSYMNSTLNAVIFISCSSELRFYTKSLFVRNMDTV